MRRSVRYFPLPKSVAAFVTGEDCFADERRRCRSGICRCGHGGVPLEAGTHRRRRRHRSAQARAARARRQPDRRTRARRAGGFGQGVEPPPRVIRSGGFRARRRCRPRVRRHAGPQRRHRRPRLRRAGDRGARRRRRRSLVVSRDRLSQHRPSRDRRRPPASDPRDVCRVVEPATISGLAWSPSFSAKEAVSTTSSLRRSPSPASETTARSSS